MGDGGGAVWREGQSRRHFKPKAGAEDIMSSVGVERRGGQGEECWPPNRSIRH